MELCVLKKEPHLFCAKVAQLVEHNLAKVGVAGSNPVFRSLFGSVVQLVRIQACHAWGREFESRPNRKIIREVAQVVAHLVWDQRVAGSSPVFPTKEKENDERIFEQL